MIVAIASDHFRHRYIFTLLPQLVALAGFAICFKVHHNPHLEYAGLFLAASGSYASMPVIVCWCATNLAGHTRRSVGTAWQVGFGNSTLHSNISFIAELMRRVHSWRHHSSILIPRGRRTLLQNRLLHLSSLHLPLKRLMPRLLLLRLQ